MEQYNVTGMSCAACSARVEKAVSSLENVTECSVNLLTNSMSVSGSATEEEIIQAVKAAGYGASKKGNEKISTSGEDIKAASETKKLAIRLISSLCFLALLMYVSMGYAMLGLWLPKFFAANPYNEYPFLICRTTAIFRRLTRRRKRRTQPHAPPQNHK